LQEKIGFAILGAGSVAKLHQQALHSAADLGAQLIAIGHYDPKRAQDFGEEFGVPCLTENEILGRGDVDVVSICTPSGQHTRQTIAAAEAGKHVLVEKPMALSLEDADRMIRVCKQAGVKLGVTLQRRAEEPFMELGSIVEAGHLGRLVTGSVTVPYYRPQEYYEQAPWRGTVEMDGGSLMNQGIHFVDLLLWCMGDPESACAFARTLTHDIEAEDTIVATLCFSEGAVATVNATTSAAPGFPHRIELYGTEGGVQIEGETIKRWETAASHRPPNASDEDSREVHAGRDPMSISQDGHIRIYRDFVQAIKDDRPPLVDGEEGRRSVSAVLMIYQSAGT
jgi:predicted dehydrogenase